MTIVRFASWTLAVALCGASGCGGDDDASGSPDAGPGVDGGTAIDGGGTPLDGGGTVRDAGPTPDGGEGDAGPTVAVTQLAAGQAHACAVEAAGTVRCWGANDHGQLGEGTTTDRLTPTLVPDLSDVTHVAAGGAHTCAILAGGAARCWGANEHGQLGNGDTTDSAVPVDVIGLTGLSQIVAGGGLFETEPTIGHTCALGSDGTVYCWGSNDENQLGNGVRGDASEPSTVPVSWSPTDLAAGYDHTCARLSDGSIGCWGNPRCGSLGIRTSGPAMVRSGAGALDLEAGGGYTCMSQLGGVVSCWGRDLERSTCPMGVIIQDPAAVPMIMSGVAGLGVALHHQCAAFTTDGTTRCWGANDRGQLGDGSPSDVFREDPGVVPGITNATSIVAGWDFTVVVLADGTLRSWGANDRGQLGDGTTTDGTVPVVVMW